LCKVEAIKTLVPNNSGWYLWDRMKRKFEITDALLCLGCRVMPPEFSVDEKAVICKKCGYTYNVINDVPACLEPDDVHLTDYSEIKPENRQGFIKIKEEAYLKKSFLQGLYTHYHRFAAQERKNKKNPITLDIGFGMGEHIAFINKKEIEERRFMCLDIDRFKLETAKASCPDLMLFQGNALKLPFASKSFDVVQMLACIEHFSENELIPVINEVKRVLKDDGIIIACYPAEGSIPLLLGQKVVHAFIERKTGCSTDRSGHHDHKITAFKLRKILKEHFKRTRRLYYPFRIPSINLNWFIDETYVK